MHVQQGNTMITTSLQNLTKNDLYARDKGFNLCLDYFLQMI